MGFEHMKLFVLLMRFCEFHPFARGLYSSNDNLAQLAAAGMGVTIVPVSALPARPAGTVRRVRPLVKREVVAVIAATSDTLVHQFVADIYRRGLPNWAGPT
jgi:DNA-binding transcriptional LysR family regulator